MSEQTEQSRPEAQRPWLIAAWPGMGNVAVIAAGYLVQKLGMKPMGEMTARGYFDIQQVTVNAGLINTPRMPRSVLYQWKNPHEGGRDLIISLSEAQPAARTYAFAQELMDRMGKLGVERVFTFASLASQLHPTQDPRIFAAATSQPVLDDLLKLDATTLEDGQIGGLNGVMLGAALEHGVHGACLLGEIPFFAAGVPNPKAAKAVLTMFCSLAGVDVEMSELEAHSEAVERAMLELMERMKQGQSAEAGEEGEDEDEDHDEEATVTEAEAASKEKLLDFDTRNRIEKMFERARRDRGKAVQLKQELDKLGVFRQYEDRFLDLFRRAE
jgi:proteasome assembly chaperone (PAC2) family protein